MTRREVLTNIICAYIQTNHGLPKLDSRGNLNDSWIHLTDAICKATPDNILATNTCNCEDFACDNWNDEIDQIEKYAY